MNQSLCNVSKKPGRTKTINFFQCDNIRLVDLPGYGYNKLGKRISTQLAAMITSYLKNRKNLKIVVQLIDCRHNLSELDLIFIKYCQAQSFTTIYIATKSDLVKKNDLTNNINRLKHQLTYKEDETHTLFLTSKLEIEPLLINQIDNFLKHHGFFD